MVYQDKTEEGLKRELAEARQEIEELKVALRKSGETIKILNKKEKRLQVAYDYLVTILLNLPIGVAILEGPEFRYFKINQILADINGLTVEEHLGRPLAEILPHAKDALLPGLREVLKTGEPTPRREFSTYLPKNPDEVRYFIDTFFPIIDADGKSVAVGVAVIDITQRKQIEETLRENEKQSREELEKLVEERTVKLQKEITEHKRTEHLLQLTLEKEKELSEVKDRFMAMVSHEFRTPLSVILSSNQLLERYSDRLSPERQRKHLSRISRQVIHLREMLDNINLVIQAETNPLVFNPDITNAEMLCYNIVEGLQGSIGVEHELIFTYEQGLGDLIVDEKLLRIILSNLLSNAIKYSPKGKVICLDVLRQDETCAFRVSDEGIGISLEDQVHLFEAYHRASNVDNVKGIGLGLKIVKDFVELHHGRIEVESIIGEGTIFTIFLPQNDSQG